MDQAKDTIKTAIVRLAGAGLICPHAGKLDQVTCHGKQQ
jgi:hypothetical protein